MIKIEFDKEKLIKSPLNYVGGKYKLLPQILPLFPDNINRFVDLFCGGLDVAINVKANEIVCNDIITPIVNMYETFQTLNAEKTIAHIHNNILKFELSKHNKEGYLNLREQYNQSKNPLDLMTLVAYCYNNQIRFNSKWGFNRAFGENRSEFNETMKSNLIKMISKINEIKIEFTNINYSDINFIQLSENDFVYADPPYLITNADYSIQASWNEDKEKKLLNILDDLNKQNIRFALSNVLEHDGKVNEILLNWSNKYNVNYLNHTYFNANADKKKKNKNSSKEVLITNYKPLHIVSNVN